jgi:plastocyanin domain-containing protein
MTVLAGVVLVFGATYLNRGAMLLGSPVTLQAARDAVLGEASGQPAASLAVAADGVVEIPLVIENTRFVPAEVSIPADRPVRLVVDRREANPCSDQLAVPALGVLEDLAPNGVTRVDLPAAKAGAYTLTCGMGMMSGRIVAGQSQAQKRAAASPGRVPQRASGAAPAAPACACCSGAAEQPTVEKRAVVEGGVQRITVDVSGGFFDPNVIRLKAGLPAEVTFTEGAGCLAQVMSDDLGFFEDLTRGGATVRLDALQPGRYQFSCGMRMVFGTIVVE